MTDLTDIERTRLRQALSWAIRNSKVAARCCEDCATPRCHTGVIRKGDYEACGKEPVAIAMDDEEGSRHFWPVCPNHGAPGSATARDATPVTQIGRAGTAADAGDSETTGRRRRDEDVHRWRRGGADAISGRTASRPR